MKELTVDADDTRDSEDEDLVGQRSAIKGYRGGRRARRRGSGGIAASMDSAQMKRVMAKADLDKRSGSFGNKKTTGEGGDLSVSMTAKGKSRRARGGSVA